MKDKVKKITLSAMFAAIICVATMILKVPSPLKGYINLGDCFVLLSGWTLVPCFGFLTAGIGSAIADIISGYTVYAPITFVVKGSMAIVAFYISGALKKKTGDTLAKAISGTLAEIIMILCYFAFEWVLYGVVISAANIPLNAMQGAAGLILGMLLAKILKKYKII